MYNIKSLIKQPACCKNSNSALCIDLVLTKINRCSQSTYQWDTGLSDFYLMIMIMMMSFIIMIMMMIMMINSLCRIFDRREALGLNFNGRHLLNVLTVANLRQAVSRIWTCAKSEFRLFWIWLCGSDNRYTTAGHHGCKCNENGF